MRMCSCRGTAGFATHEPCLAEQAKILWTRPRITTCLVRDDAR